MNSANTSELAIDDPPLMSFCVSTMLHVYLFGGLHLRWKDDPLPPIRSRVARSLFAQAAGNPVPREIAQPTFCNRETLAKARFMRQALDEARWEQLRGRLEEEFRSRFQDPIEYINEAHLAVGTKSYA